MTRPSKYEMAERTARAIQRSDKAIAGISEGTLTVAFMNLRLEEVGHLFATNVDSNWLPTFPARKP
jgi:hypothetical protein